jgi:hypothetical protein
MANAEVGVSYSREAKINLVHTWQRHYNMQPRDDSQLTHMFADGTIALQADEVARELMATDFIYKHTLYGQLIEEFMRHVATYVNRTYHISWKATWKIVKFYGPRAIKLICLLNSGQHIPVRMPDEDLPSSLTATTESTEGDMWPELVTPPTHSDHSESQSTTSS